MHQKFVSLIILLFIITAHSFCQTGIIRSEIGIVPINQSFSLSQIDSAGGVINLLTSEDTLILKNIFEFNDIDSIDSLVVSYSHEIDTTLLGVISIDLNGFTSSDTIQDVVIRKENNWLTITYPEQSMSLPFLFQVQWKTVSAVTGPLQSYYYD